MNTGLFLFTNDLRIQDNRALFTAARQCQRLILLYVIDEAQIHAEQYQCKSIGVARQNFMAQAVDDLAQQVRLLDQHLVVKQGKTLAVLQQLVTVYDVDAIFYSASSDYHQQRQFAHYRQQLAKPAKLDKPFKPDKPRVSDEIDARKVDLHWQGVWQHTLFEQAQLPFDIENIPNTFSKFRRQLEHALPEIAQPQQLTSLPPSPELLAVDQANDSASALQLNTDTESLFEGGSHAGQLQLTIYFQSDLPQSYKETRNALDNWASSTKFSPWLAVGCLSARQVYWALKKHEHQQGENESTYWIFFELLWREYFHWLAKKVGDQLYSFSGLGGHKPLTSFHSERFIKWQLGLTPYPLVNAIMHQLNDTGYISNRARQISASCLVNELALDWRYGAAYFQQQLIDYDAAANWGNWQYIAGVGADPRGGRHFNLEKQQQLFDPNFEYIGKWQGERLAEPIDSVDMVDWPIASHSTLGVKSV